MLLPADIAAPPVSFVLGVAVVFLLVPIIVAEAIVLRVLRWGGLGRAFVAALAMNIASSLVGFALLSTIENGEEVDLTAARLLLLLPAWAGSTAIEGGVMWAFERLPLGRTFGIAAIANFVSYLLIAGYLYLMLVTNG